MMPLLRGKKVFWWRSLTFDVKGSYFVERGKFATNGLFRRRMNAEDSKDVSVNQCGTQSVVSYFLCLRVLRPIDIKRRACVKSGLGLWLIKYDQLSAVTPRAGEAGHFASHTR